MSVLYVTSDAPGAGKTAVCVTLAAQLRRMGKRAAVFKPLLSAGASGPDPDAGAYDSLLGQPTGDWPFPQLKSGITAKLENDITGALENAAAGVDIVLAEAPAEVPGPVERRLVDLLGARVLAVVAYGPGLQASELTERLSAFGEALLGTLVNRYTRYRGGDVQSRLMPAMASAGLNPLGAVPEDPLLLGISVAELASRLGGTLAVGADKVDGLVAHVMVGGLGMDSGEGYFGLRDNKAVVVRGDRPDIHMAALLTPTSCLVLTGGVAPIEYVRYEAELERVPIMVVELDTLSTMDAVSALGDGARFDHPA